MLSLRTRVLRAYSAFISNETGETALDATPRAQTAVGCYILEIGKGGPGLLNDPQQPEALVKKHIGLDQRTQSVFQASNDIEELEILAALLTGRTHAGGPEPRYGFRFLQGDFDGLPIRLEHTPQDGGTGVRRVDCRHYDLESDVEGYTQLMRRLIERLRAGEHRIRIAGTLQIAQMLRAFSDLNDSEISAAKKSRCHSLLKNYNRL
jgi:hypothetical protein